MLTVILIVLLVLFLFGGLRGPGNLKNVAWFLLVIVAVFFILQLV